MKNKYKRYWKVLPATVLISLTAGVINGLFGTGGGILIVYLLSWLYRDSASYDTKDIFAMTVGAVILMSCSSLYFYLKNGYVSFSDTSGYLLPAAIGGIIGAFLLDKLNASLMKKIFAVLVIYAGITLIFR